MGSPKKTPGFFGPTLAFADGCRTAHFDCGRRPTGAPSLPVEDVIPEIVIPEILRWCSLTPHHCRISGKAMWAPEWLVSFWFKKRHTQLCPKLASDPLKKKRLVGFSGHPTTKDKKNPQEPDAWGPARKGPGKRFSVPQGREARRSDSGAAQAQWCHVRLRVKLRRLSESYRTDSESPSKLWMDEIRSHHFEPMGNHCLLVGGKQRAPPNKQNKKQKGEAHAGEESSGVRFAELFASC